jgi:hypothetical protein
MVEHTCNPSTQKAEAGRWTVQKEKKEKKKKVRK